MPRLRFVEITADKQNVEILENLPSQIIGHKGKVKPQITNGHISKHHATVCFLTDGIDDSWLVIDGDVIAGVQSTNGLRDSEGEKVTGKVTLRDPGDRVYLLYMYNTNAYLEVFNTEIEKVNATNGLDEEDIKPQLSKISVNTSILKNEVVSVNSQVQDNKVQIGSLNSKLDGIISSLAVGLDHVEEVGSKPKVFITGFTIIFTAVILSIMSFGIYRNINHIIRQVFHIQIDIKDLDKLPEK